MKKLFGVSSFSLILLLIAALASMAAYELEVPMVGTPPVIDGALDDAVWSVAATADIILKNDTSEPIEDPAYNAVAYVAYDAENLYVAFENGNPTPDQIVTASPGHDQDVWKDEENEIFLEPANAGTKPYFHIMLNAANVIQDAESGGAEAGWEPALETATVIGTDAWYAELRIPFVDLGFSTAPIGKTWGGNFNRHIVSAYDWWVMWADVGASFHTPERFGDIIFGSEVTAVTPLDKMTTTWSKIKQIR